jgi:hypothetical protein
MRLKSNKIILQKKSLTSRSFKDSGEIGSRTRNYIKEGFN